MIVAVGRRYDRLRQKFDLLDAENAIYVRKLQRFKRMRFRPRQRKL